MTLAAKDYSRPKKIILTLFEKKLYVIVFHFVGELPGFSSLYEFFWNGEERKWIPWSKLVPKYIHNPESKFYEILVPTVDTVRATWLLQLMVGIKRPVVLIGETGTSKTATIAAFLRTVDQESHVSVHEFPFSLASANIIRLMPSHLNKLPCKTSFLHTSFILFICLCPNKLFPYKFYHLISYFFRISKVMAIELFVT